MKRLYQSGGLAIVVVVMLSCGKKDGQVVTESEFAPVVTDIRIILKTDRGDISATMFATKAPITVASFLNLARRDFYDGLTFHQVVENFMIQGGDPDGNVDITVEGSDPNGTRGGPGYFLPNEIAPSLKHNKAGIFSMARKTSKPDTAGSQFFITLGPAAHLDGGYSIFGEVTEGLGAVKQIEVGDRIVDIQILDSTDALFLAQEANLKNWNDILEQRSTQ